MHNLSTRAMLADLTIRQWTAQKLDRDVTNEVADTKHAGRDAGRYNKRLIAKEALADIQSAVSQAKATHYAHTSPWSDSGVRILSNANYLDYMAKIDRIRVDFETAVAAFLDRYDHFRDEARLQLGDMFNCDDYPPRASIASRFEMGVDIDALPESTDFRCAISDDAAEAIRQDIEQRMGEKTNAAMRDAFERVATVTRAMVARLNAYEEPTQDSKAKGVFRDSLVGNVRDLVAVLPGLNLTGDSDLDVICDELKAITKFDASNLRGSVLAREETARKAATILSKVEAYIA